MKKVKVVVDDYKEYPCPICDRLVALARPPEPGQRWQCFTCINEFKNRKLETRDRWARGFIAERRRKLVEDAPHLVGPRFLRSLVWAPLENPANEYHPVEHIWRLDWQLWKERKWKPSEDEFIRSQADQEEEIDPRSPEFQEKQKAVFGRVIKYGDGPIRFDH